MVIANEKNIKGVVQKILDASEVIIVSPESISMISEAVSAGKYVVVFGVRARGKYGLNVANLEKQGYIKIAEAGKIYNTINQVLKEKPAVRELRDRSKIVEKLTGII